MVSQFNSACARECSYLLDDPFKGEVLDNFDTANGIARLSSSNTNFDKMSITISIQCTSTYSEIPAGTTPPLTIQFNLLDKCRTSSVEMPTIVPDTQNKYLWEATYSPFPLGYNTLNCGPITYQLIGLPQPTFQITEDPQDSSALTIRTEAVSRAQLGVYEYYIQGCITFASDNTQVCGRTNDLRIVMKDPCPDTVPYTESIRLLSASQLNVDGVFLTWMAGDSVDDATKDYGVGKCGDKTIQIFDAQTDLPVYWLEWSSALGALSFKPDLDTPIGLRSYYYVITMVNYDSQWSKQPFQAEVLGCVV